MNRVLPEDSVVGAWDTGVIGYFSRVPVVNLDGVVNSYEYLRVAEDEMRAGGGSMYSWLLDSRRASPEAVRRKFGITHLANVMNAKQRINTTLFEGPLYLINNKQWKESQFKLWSAEPPEASSGELDPASWFWERMKPHFAYQHGDVRLIVDGRLAQAFARDCASGELIVWTWDGQGDETVVNPWTQTQTGPCVDALVLPRDAPSTVRAKSMTAGEYLADLVGDREPIICSNWDVHLIENSLIYIKAPCGQDDTAAKFLLHLDPVDKTDLPDHRKQHGFDNLDFNFYWYGVIFDGTCLATVPLPQYGITGIRTGQYVRVEGGFDNLWKGEIRLGE